MKTAPIQRKIYDPIGQCIYCGEVASTSMRLGDEHIIPRSIGGGLILREASCRDCEKETSKIEDNCAKMLFHEARAHFKISGRKEKRTRTKIRVPLRAPSKTFPINDYPLSLYAFVLWPPQILDPSITPAVRGKRVELLSLFLSDDFNDRLRNVGTANFIVPVRPDTFARQLAKIGHAYAVAELGLSGFIPFLCNLIRGIPPFDPYFHIGGSRYEKQTSRRLGPTPKHFHEVDISFPKKDGKTLVVVRIRLFSQYGMPTYFAVVGETRHDQGQHL